MKSKRFTLIGLSALFVSLLVSCKKDFQNSDAVSTSGSNAAIARYNPFGLNVMKSASDENPDHITNPDFHYLLSETSSIALANDYGVQYYRMKISHDAWVQNNVRDTFFVNYKNANQHGLKVVLNVNWDSQEDTPQPFANPADYTDFLSDVLDSCSAMHLKPAMIVVENEEGNYTKHQIDTSSVAGINADCQKYVDILNAAVSVCKTYTWWDGTRGQKLTNGGYTTRQLTFLVWDWLKNEKNQPDQARTYANNTMPPAVVKDLYEKPQPPYIANPIAIGKFYTASYSSVAFSYTNVHWYEPVKIRNWSNTREHSTPWKKGVSPDTISKGGIDWVLAYLGEKIPKKIISNEAGQLTNSSKLNKAITDKFLSRPFNAFDIAVWFDGDGKGNYDPVALHNTIEDAKGNWYYTFRSNGLQFKTTNAGLK